MEFLEWTSHDTVGSSVRVIPCLLFVGRITESKPALISFRQQKAEVFFRNFPAFKFLEIVTLFPTQFIA